MTNNPIVTIIDRLFMKIRFSKTDNFYNSIQTVTISDFDYIACT